MEQKCYPYAQTHIHVSDDDDILAFCTNLCEKLRSVCESRGIPQSVTPRSQNDENTAAFEHLNEHNIYIKKHMNADLGSIIQFTEHAVSKASVELRRRRSPTIEFSFHQGEVSIEAARNDCVVAHMVLHNCNSERALENKIMMMQARSFRTLPVPDGSSRLTFPLASYASVCRD